MTEIPLLHTTKSSKLADAELIILSNAANRDDHIAIPVPDALSAKSGDTERALKRLLKRKLLEELPAKLEDGLWRKDAGDRHLTLRITAAGFEAINLDAPSDLTPSSAGAKSKGEAGTTKTEASTKANRRAPRKAQAFRNKGTKPATNKQKGSKAERVIALLKRANGASLEDMMKATGWQAHSVRGFLSGVVKKKLRLSLVASEDDKGTRRDRLNSRGKS